MDSQRNLLTKKQETFCLNILKGMSQYESYVQAGYSTKSKRAILDIRASEIASNSKVLVRINELRQKAASPTIMAVIERKERLSEIARTNLTDFMELGQDGSWVNIGKETPNSGAIQEIHSRTEYDDNGAHPTVHTSVKLHDPLKAIDLLNKMDKLYSEAPIVNVDNRKVEIYVGSDKAKQLVEKIVSGRLLK
jgi:phage terminase small subunit